MLRDTSSHAQSASSVSCPHTLLSVVRTQEQQKEPAEPISMEWLSDEIVDIKLLIRRRVSGSRIS